MTVASVESIVNALHEVRARIDAAMVGDRQVRLIAVTKAFPAPIIGNAIEAGLSDLGENYAQELAEKQKWLAARPSSPTEIRWHFIGGLQQNKVKLLAGRVDLWHSIDRASLIDEIAKRSAGDRILIQVNTTDERQKAGCDPLDARSLVERGRERGLAVEGLMTVGPTGEADPRPSFDRLRLLAESCEVEELSMGMSGDFEAAVTEGSTMVRVGSALFGDRPIR